MKRFLRVFIICGLVLIALPGLISAVDLSKGIILDIPQEKVESQFGKIPLSQLTPQDSSAMASFRFTGDTLKVLAIMIEWSNRKGTYSRETFDSLLFSRNVFPGGSVADYFSQPTATSFMRDMATLGIEQIFTSYDNPKGNADTERMIRTIKEEIIWLNEFSSFEEAKEKIGRWVEINYNKLYVHSGLRYMSPEEFEALYSDKTLTKVT